MGTTTTTARMTFAEFERLPDQPGKREMLEGELIELPPAESKHTKLSYRICKLLDAAVSAAHLRGEAASLGETYPQMGYKLSPESYVQPDVSVTHAGQAEAKYLAGAPAISIEVMSASNTPERMKKKLRLYFAHGALEVWQVDRKTRRVAIHTRLTSQTIGDHDTLTTPLLPGF